MAFIFGFSILLMTMLFYGIRVIRDTSIESAQSTVLESGLESAQALTELYADALARAVEQAGGAGAAPQSVCRPMLEKLRFGKDSSSYFILFEGTTCRYHENRDLLDKNLVNRTDINGLRIFKQMEKTALDGGGFTRYLEQDRLGYRTYQKVAYSTLIPGTMLWLGMEVPTQGIEATEQRLTGAILGIANAISLELGLAAAFVLLLLLLPLSVAIHRSVIPPLRMLTYASRRLALGDLEVGFESDYRDEIGRVAQGMDRLQQSLRDKTVFAEKVGQGLFDWKFQRTSEHDVLGQSLLEMRENLIRAQREEDQRKLEEARRNWAAEGMASFSELFRETSDEARLGDQLTRRLVKYLEANQGGLFLTHEWQDKGELELVAAYAFERERHLRRAVRPGEGLVGAAFVERETVLMANLPEGYTQIKSGLGSAAPRNLLLVPLKTSEEVLGVVELASFKPFEPHQVAFVERIAETLATSLSNVRANQKTAQLLRQSQEQSVAMKETERRLRESLEQMREAQQEAQSREQTIQMKMEELTRAQARLQEKDVEQEKEIQSLKAENFEQMDIIRRKERRLRIVMKYALDALLTVGPSGELEFVNESALRLFGYPTEQEMLGLRVWELLPELFEASREGKARDFRRSKDGLDLEKLQRLDLKARDGSPLRVLLNLVQAKVEGKSQYTLFIKDVSQEEGRDLARVEKLSELAHKLLEAMAQAQAFRAVLEANFLPLPSFGEGGPFQLKALGLETGLAVPDAHHAELLRLAHRLDRAYQKRLARAQADDLLEQMEALATKEFDYEEQVFRKFDYPKAEEHTQRHAELLERLRQARLRLRQAAANLEFDLPELLRAWLFVHIREHDQAYVHWFQKHGVK